MDIMPQLWAENVSLILMKVFSQNIIHKKYTSKGRKVMHFISNNLQGLDGKDPGNLLSESFVTIYQTSVREL